MNYNGKKHDPKSFAVKTHQMVKSDPKEIFKVLNDIE